MQGSYTDPAAVFCMMLKVPYQATLQQHVVTVDGDGWVKALRRGTDKVATCIQEHPDARVVMHWHDRADFREFRAFTQLHDLDPLDLVQNLLDTTNPIRHNLPKAPA